VGNRKQQTALRAELGLPRSIAPDYPYKRAKAAKGQPDGLVRNVIYPVVSETTLEDLIREAGAGENHEHQVKLVARASYSHHYRRIVPELLAALSFQCNNRPAPPSDGRTWLFLKNTATARSRFFP
jgi:hypothetical protein